MLFLLSSLAVNLHIVVIAVNLTGWSVTALG